MKTAIYTIAKNEEQHAERFMKSVADADFVVVGDTGSTDRTAEIIRDLGGTVVPLQVRPWRFDVPRNTMLSILPADIDFCCALDLDEVFRPGWRDTLEKSDWLKGQYNRLRFRYIHSFDANGIPNVTGVKEFAHTRFNYFWQHAVHETLYYTGAGSETTLSLPTLVVEHRQDKTKSRSNYKDLLLTECKSLTATPRHMFWLIREYVTAAEWPNVLIWSEKFLACPDTWAVEQAHAHRYAAKAQAQLGYRVNALASHMLSITCAPREREPWLDLAWYYHADKQWEAAYLAVLECLKLTTRPEHYLATAEAWGYKVHELAALGATKLQLWKQANDHIAMAIKLAPDVKHLKRTAEQIAKQGR